MCPPESRRPRRQVQNRKPLKSEAILACPTLEEVLLNPSEDGGALILILEISTCSAGSERGCYVDGRRRGIAVRDSALGAAAHRFSAGRPKGREPPPPHCIMCCVALYSDPAELLVFFLIQNTKMYKQDERICTSPSRYLDIYMGAIAIRFCCEGCLERALVGMYGISPEIPIIQRSRMPARKPTASSTSTKNENSNNLQQLLLGPPWNKFSSTLLRMEGLSLSFL